MLTSTLFRLQTFHRLQAAEFLYIRKVCVVSVFAAALALLSAADAFELFPMDQDCACVRLLKSHRLLRAEERRVGDELFQVFLKRTTGKEEFRVRIGTVSEMQELKLWRYGLAVARDFNRDGIVDFSWYGGDDTSHDRLLFLSSPAGYRRVDINETFAKKWHRITGQWVDFNIGKAAFLENVVFPYTADGIFLTAEIGTLSAPSKQQPCKLRAEEREFVISR